MAKTTKAINVSIGASLKELEQAMRDAGILVEDFSAKAKRAGKEGAGGFEQLEKSAKSFKREQVQEGRLVGFYVKEITSFTGASQGAQAAMGGLIQGVAGFATASGPLLAVWAGFEVFKGLAAWFTEIGDEAAKAAEQAAAAVGKLGDQLAGLQNKRLGVTDSQVTGGRVDSARRLLAEREAAVAEAQDEGRYASGLGDSERVQNIEKQIAEWEKLNGKLETYISLQTKIASEQRALEGVQVGPGTKEGLDKFSAESGKAQEAAKKVREEAEKTRNMWMQTFGPGNTEGAWVFEQAKKALDEIDAGIRAQNAREAASYDAGTFDLSGVSASDVNAKRLDKEVQQNIRAAQMVQDAWNAVGSGISSVFSSIGTAIGGAAGNFIGQIGAMIAQTLALVVALAFSDSLMMGPMGLFAAIPMAAALLGSVIGMIAGIPSYEVGTPYVPQTGLAMLHQGERVIPAGENSRGGSITVNLSMIDAQSGERWLRRNDNALIRVLRDASRAGRV